MSDNAQKTHLAQSLNRFAEGKVLDALQLTGKALPARVTAVDGSIVTIEFLLTGPFTLPNVTCPMFGPEYIRYPTQVGDLGVVIPADYYIGGVSGLGGGTAGLGLQANLSSIIFFPIANSAWVKTDDPDALVLYSPDRVTAFELHKSGAISGHGEQTLDGSFTTTGNIAAGTGATGTFQSADGQTVQVADGIITGLT